MCQNLGDGLVINAVSILIKLIKLVYTLVTPFLGWLNTRGELFVRCIQILKSLLASFTTAHSMLGCFLFIH